MAQLSEPISAVEPLTSAETALLKMPGMIAMPFTRPHLMLLSLLTSHLKTHHWFKHLSQEKHP